MRNFAGAQTMGVMSRVDISNIHFHDTKIQ
jgi:hypothetical protein